MALTIDLKRGIHRRIYSGAVSGKRINAISDVAERVFWRLHMVCDDFGNFDADPDILKAKAFPMLATMTARKIAGAVKELAAARLIAEYESNGDRLGHICDFAALQPGGKNGKRIRRFHASPWDDDDLSGESRGIRVNPGESRCIKVNPDFSVKSSPAQDGDGDGTGTGDVDVDVDGTGDGDGDEADAGGSDSGPVGAVASIPDPDPVPGSGKAPDVPTTRRLGTARWLVRVEKLFRPRASGGGYRADKTSADRLFDLVWPENAMDGPARLDRALRIVQESAGADRPMAYITKRIKQEFPQ